MNANITETYETAAKAANAIKNCLWLILDFILESNYEYLSKVILTYNYSDLWRLSKGCLFKQKKTGYSSQEKIYR